MANKRVDLTIIPHVALPPSRSDRRQLEDPGDAATSPEVQVFEKPSLLTGIEKYHAAVGRSGGLEDQFPSLEAAKRELMVQQSFRLPLSQVQALETLKADKGIVPSAFVRDCIARGLREIQIR